MSMTAPVVQGTLVLLAISAWCQIWLAAGSTAGRGRGDLDRTAQLPRALGEECVRHGVVVELAHELRRGLLERVALGEWVSSGCPGRSI